jgi:hypothetical protein
LLYHYTSEQGLLGIIGNNNIRATHIRFLNDWTELREAFTEKYVQILVDSFRVGLPKHFDENARRIMDGMLSERNNAKILDIIESPKSTNETFVCCFTASAGTSRQPGEDPGDRLSQWRGYSHSEQGFSLGFDEDLLRKRIELDNPHAKAALLRCVYGNEERTLFFKELGNAASIRFNALRASNEPVPGSFITVRPNASEEYRKLNYYFSKSLSGATAAFFTKAAQIKHIGFREECEWRVVFQARRDALFPVDKTGKHLEIVKFRDGQFGRTPFIEIPLGLTEPETSPLRRIVVGPGTHKDDVKRSVELLLLSHGIQVRPDKEKGVEIATSLIPYRSG